MQVRRNCSITQMMLWTMFRKSVDVVISDVNMPDKTGLEMIREMKELLPDTYYILLSGYQEFEYVKKSHEP